MESANNLQFRDDLVITEQVEGDQTVFIVKEPASQKYFRLKRHEYLIATQFDGSRSLPEVHTHLRDNLKIQVTEEILQKFAAKLEQNGLLLRTGLEANDSAVEPEAKTCNQPAFRRDTQTSRLGKVLYWKIAHVDPDELFNRLLPRVRFLFTKSFCGFAAFTIFVGLYITANNWDEIAAEIHSLFSAQSLVLAFAVMMPLVVFHEMAHGMVCKYFGGEVHEMGFLLLYFQPSCYCNVSDSYLFKKKSQRIWVMAAGVFIQAFLWAILTILWRILTPESLISRLIFVTIAVSGVITLFQFNPLLKLDGYYLLAEIFSIPNLRTKSFCYLRAWLKRMLTGASPGFQDLTARTRRVYWIYGLIAFLYSFSFLKYFILRFERFFVEQYQGTGFILFWGLALFVVSEPLAQSVGNIFPKRVTERKQVLARHKNLFVTSFLCLAGVLILTVGRWELKVANECMLIPFERAEVRAEVSGTIDEIYFDEGQTVHAGDIIARLADYKYSGQKAQTLARISEAQAQLQLMLAGPSKEESALAQSQVERAESGVKKAEAQIPIARERVDFAAKNFERAKKMFDERLLASMSFEEAQRDLNIRKRELDEVQHDIEEKRKQLQEAKKSQAKVMAGVRPQEIEAKRAEIDGLLAQEKLLELESAYTAIRSPIDGVITTHFLKQKEKVYLNQGDVICTVANTKKIITEIPVSEKEVGDVKVGFPVRLKANAYPTKEFDGRVTQISNVADPQNNNIRAVMVRSEIDNPEFLLKPDMTGYAKIYCGQRTIGELVTRRMVRFIRTEFWSWF